MESGTMETVDTRNQLLMCHPCSRDPGIPREFEYGMFGSGSEAQKMAARSKKLECESYWERSLPGTHTQCEQC